MEEAGRECILLPGDISEEAHCKHIVDETVKKFGHINVLVNNAAFQVCGRSHRQESASACQVRLVQGCSAEIA